MSKSYLLCLLLLLVVSHSLSTLQNGKFLKLDYIWDDDVTEEEKDYQDLFNNQIYCKNYRSDVK